MGYAVCVSYAGRWVWDFWVENPTETPQVNYKAVCVDFKIQEPLERTTNVSSKYRRTCARPAQHARTERGWVVDVLTLFLSL
jgi:hypothetical protein